MNIYYKYVHTRSHSEMNCIEIAPYTSKKLVNSVRRSPGQLLRNRLVSAPNNNIRSGLYDCCIVRHKNSKLIMGVHCQNDGSDVLIPRNHAASTEFTKIRSITVNTHYDGNGNVCYKYAYYITTDDDDLCGEAGSDEDDDVP